MTKIVMDTNTLISAIGWKKGNPRKIFEKCLAGEFTLARSTDLMKEFLKVMNRPKFNFISDEDKQAFSLHLLQVCELVETKTRLNIIKEDPDDNIVLECAVDAKADYIVSGDRHLLNLKEFKGIKIVSPRSFLTLIENNLKQKSD